MTKPLNPSLRRIIKLALPICVGNVGQMCLQLTDIMVVGRVSAEAVGAVGIGSAIFSFAMFFGLGLLSGLDTLTSQSIGRGDEQTTQEAFRQSLILATLYGVPATAVLVLFSQYAVTHISLDRLVIHPTQVYLSLLSLSLYPVLLFQCARQYLQATGRALVGMWFLIFGNIANLILAVVLVLGVGSFHGLGVRGAALATTALRAVGALVILWIVSRTIRVRPNRVNAEILHLLVKIGFPTALQLTFELGAFALATLIVGRLPPDAIAAHQIVLNAANFTFMIPLGIATAGTIVVGNYVGTGNFSEARREGWLCLKLGGLFMASTAVLFALIPERIIRLYTPQDSVVLTALVPMYIAAGFQLFDGTQAVASGILRGLGQTKWPALINGIGHWFIGLPLGCYLCFHGYGLNGIWIGFASGLFTVSILLVGWWNILMSRLSKEHSL